MKVLKILATLMVLLFTTGLIFGCAQLEPKESSIDLESTEVGAPDESSAAASAEATSEAESSAGGKLKVIASIFPQYDFLRQIAGDKIELKMLLTPGAEMHSYEPTPKDLIEINDSDLFVYVGGHSDTWVKKLIENREGKLNLALVDMVDTYSEEIVEGMEHEHEHDHDHDADEHEDEDHEHDHDNDADEHEDEDHEHDHDHDADEHEHEDADHEHDHDHEHEHSHELDEHVWTDPENAIKIVKRLTQALVELDPANAEFYQANADKYVSELEKLDQDFEEMVESAKRKTIVVGDRFPFRYLVEAYDLDYYAAFPGCSTEGDASPQTLVFLIDKVKSEQIPVVFHIELSNMKMAESIADATGSEVMLLHGAHNISKEDFEQGLTYLEIMRQNLENLRHALND